MFLMINDPFKENGTYHHISEMFFIQIIGNQDQTKKSLFVTSLRHWVVLKLLPSILMHH